MCYRPVHVWQAGVDKFFPCGHCLQCLKQYQDQWIARLSEEVKCWRDVDGFKPIVFFTLKYANETIPCSYLVATSNGPRLTYSVPDCPIYPFWREHYNVSRETPTMWNERKRTYLDMWAKYRENLGLVPDAVHDEGMVYSDFASQDLPDSYDSFAFEFHTVEKSHVQDWLKRCRQRFVRQSGVVYHGVNERMVTTWVDSEGRERSLPSNAISSLKYFITSEYGPNTQRPHLHGCIFGITYDEFERFFAEDWRSNFGTIEFSVFDPARGAMAYIAKYCSKGNYEHPYCTRDFFYSSGKEYHSDHYENCVKDFCVDMPLVRPTFHLISKGIGVSYCFNREIQDYFATRLVETLSPSGRVNYITTDAGIAVGLYPSDDSLIQESRTIDIVEESGSSYLVRKYNYNGTLTGESRITMDSIIDRAVEEIMLTKKYHRTYVKKSNVIDGRPVTAACIPCWHKLGKAVPYHLVTATTEIALPRYFRRWLISPLAQALRSSAAVRVHPASAGYSFRDVQQGRLSDSRVTSILQDLGRTEALQKNSHKNVWKSAERFYLRPSLGESSVELLGK